MDTSQEHSISCVSDTTWWKDFESEPNQAAEFWTHIQARQQEERCSSPADLTDVWGESACAANKPADQYPAVIMGKSWLKQKTCFSLKSGCCYNHAAIFLDASDAVTNTSIWHEPTWSLTKTHSSAARRFHLLPWFQNCHWDLTWFSDCCSEFTASFSSWSLSGPLVVSAPDWIGYRGLAAGRMVWFSWALQAGDLRALTSWMWKLCPHVPSAFEHWHLTEKNAVTPSEHHMLLALQSGEKAWITITPWVPLLCLSICPSVVVTTVWLESVSFKCTAAGVPALCLHSGLQQRLVSSSAIFFQFSDAGHRLSVVSSLNLMSCIKSSTDKWRVPTAGGALTVFSFTNSHHHRCFKCSAARNISPHQLYKQPFIPFNEIAEWCNTSERRSPLQQEHAWSNFMALTHLCRN